LFFDGERGLRHGGGPDYEKEVMYKISMHIRQWGNGNNFKTARAAREDEKGTRRDSVIVKG
jgi:hypothetical protein